MVPGMVAPIPIGNLEVARQLMVATRNNNLDGEYSLSSSKVWINRSITEMQATWPISWDRIMVIPHKPAIRRKPLLP